MGLESRHRERDLELPRHRQTLLKEIEQDLLSDENVLAVFYGGSSGKQNTDLYSDIDLRIVVKEELFEEYRVNKRERAKNWGSVLYYEDFPWTAYTVAHYDSFIKVDVFYYKTESIQPSNWLQHIKVVYDKTGFMGEIQEKSERLSYHPTVAEVEMWRTKFFAYVHEAYRRANRKEMYYALNCLDHIRISMAIAWYMDKGVQPNAFGDWAKYEGERSELDSWQLSLLASWRSSREPDDVMNIIEKIIPAFKKTHKSLCEKLGMEENQEWVDEILAMVL